MKRVLLLLGLVVLSIVSSYSALSVNDCRSIVEGDLDPDREIILTSSFQTNGSGTCFDIEPNNILFNCQGNYIDGNDTGDLFFLSNISQFYDNVTFDNCEFRNSSYIARGNVFFPFLNNSILNETRGFQINFIGDYYLVNTQIIQKQTRINSCGIYNNPFFENYSFSPSFPNTSTSSTSTCLKLSSINLDCNGNTFYNTSIEFSDNSPLVSNVINNVSLRNCFFINSSIVSEEILNNSIFENLFFDNIDKSKNVFDFESNNSIFDNITALNLDILITGNLENSVLNNFFSNNSNEIIKSTTKIKNSSISNFESLNFIRAITNIYGVDNSIFSNMIFKSNVSTPDNIIGIDSSENTIIENFFVNTTSYSGGIRLNDGVNITIRNNYLINTVGLAIGRVSMFPSENLYVYNNTVIDSQNGLRLLSVRNSYIYDNIFINNTFDYSYFGSDPTSGIFIYNNYFSDLNSFDIVSPENFNSNFTYLGQGNTYGNDTAFSGTVCHATGVCDTNATVLTYAEFNTLIEPLLPASSTLSSVVSSFTGSLFPVFGLGNIIILLGGLFLYFM